MLLLLLYFARVCIYLYIYRYAHTHTWVSMHINIYIQHTYVRFLLCTVMGVVCVYTYGISVYLVYMVCI